MEDNIFLYFSKVDTLSVVLFSLCGAAVSELLGWLLMYRSDNYKNLAADIERMARKMDKQKMVVSGGGKWNRQKTEEDSLKSRAQQLNWLRTKAQVASGVLHLFTVRMLYRRFDGIVVAKLPFQTILFLKSLSHQSLPGDDATDCSVMFLYFLAVGVFRQVLPKLLGTAAPPGMPQQGSPFGNLGAEPTGRS